MRVCQFSGKTNSFDFFSQNFPKNRFRVGNSKNYCRNKNQHPQDLGLKFEKTSRYCVCMCVCTNFQAKQTALTFAAQICSKIDLGLAIQKAIVGIRISILDILCVLIFSQNEQL